VVGARIPRIDIREAVAITSAKVDLTHLPETKMISNRKIHVPTNLEAIVLPKFKIDLQPLKDIGAAANLLCGPTPQKGFMATMNPPMKPIFLLTFMAGLKARFSLALLQTPRETINLISSAHYLWAFKVRSNCVISVSILEGL
jgi:hypothetical protein